MWFDAFYIPSDASHVNNAEKFINYMLRPKVIAETTNTIAFANANQASTPYIDKAVLTDPSIYPDDATLGRLFSKKPKEGKAARLITRTWSRIKTGD